MKKTDTQKTLEELKKAGEKGIHSFHLNLAVGTTRSAARIQDLKDLGYKISTKYEKINNVLGVRYFLQDIPKDSPLEPKKKPTYIFDSIRQVYIQI